MPVARVFGLLRLLAMTGLDVFLYFLVFVILGKVLKGVFSPLQSIEIASPSARNDDSRFCHYEEAMTFADEVISAFRRGENTTFF